MTANHERKEPRKVPRPNAELPAPPKPGITENSDGSVHVVGTAAFLKRSVANNLVGPRE
jgi:hypothetical protein